MDSNLQQIVSLCSTVDSEISNLESQITDISAKFISGNLGFIERNLHRMPSPGPEGLYQWHFSFSVGGGQSTTGASSFAPAVGNNPAQFGIQPNGNANCYGWLDLPLPSQFPRIVVDKRTFGMTPAEQANQRGLEFESQLSWNDFTHNMAWQHDQDSKSWRYFDFTKKDWVAVPGISFTDFSLGPVEVIAVFALDGIADTTTHVSLSIAGTVFPVNITQAATPTSAGNKFTTAIQIDGLNGLASGVSILQHDVVGVF